MLSEEELHITDINSDYGIKITKEVQMPISDTMQLSGSMIDEVSDFIPHECYCPITHEIMQDPVIAQDGHTYEREEIQNWFSKGNRISPKTGIVLSSTELIANHAVRNLTQDLKGQIPTWCRLVKENKNIKERMDSMEERMIEREFRIRNNMEFYKKEIEELQYSNKLANSRLGILEQNLNEKEQKIKEFSGKIKELLELCDKKDEEIQNLMGLVYDKRNEENRNSKKSDEIMEQAKQDLAYFIEIQDDYKYKISKPFFPLLNVSAKERKDLTEELAMAIDKNDAAAVRRFYKTWHTAITRFGHLKWGYIRGRIILTAEKYGCITNYNSCHDSEKEKIKNSDENSQDFPNLGIPMIQLK